MGIDLTCFSWIQLIKKSKLPPNAKFVAFYLSTFMNLEQDIAWPSQSRISYETGLSKRTVIRMIQELNDHGWISTKKASHTVKGQAQTYLHNEYIIQIPLEVKQSIRRDIMSSQVVAGVTNQTSRGDTDDIAGVTQWHPNNNKNNNSNKGRFTPPTLDQVKQYCEERNNEVDPQKFIDHYQTTNWMRGKNKIKDWKACVRTWERTTPNVKYGEGAI